MILIMIVIAVLIAIAILIIITIIILEIQDRMEHLKTSFEEKVEYLGATFRKEAQEIKDHLEVVHQYIDKLSSSTESPQAGGKYDDGDCYCRYYFHCNYYFLVIVSVKFSTFNYGHTHSLGSVNIVD